MHQNTSPSIVTKKNTKYVSFDGYFEAVYSYNKILLNEGKYNVDMGTYNYAPSGKSFLDHFSKDMFTYNSYRNTHKKYKNLSNGEGVY